MTPEKLKELREIASKSTKVVAWYPHAKEVRGPYNRWFTLLYQCSAVESEYIHHVADTYDECAFAAAAMNNLVPLLDHIDMLEKQCVNSNDVVAKLGDTIQKLQTERDAFKLYLERQIAEVQKLWLT